jgi:transcription-repair coupling factor (superfamily II helicase)
VLNLLEVARLRTAARRAGLTDITAAGNHIKFAPVELPDAASRARLGAFVADYERSQTRPAIRRQLVLRVTMLAIHSPLAVPLAA